MSAMAEIGELAGRRLKLGKTRAPCWSISIKWWFHHNKDGSEIGTKVSSLNRIRFQHAWEPQS